MDIFEAYDYLADKVQELVPEVSIQDNLVDKPVSYPCVVIEIDGSRLQQIGGGSLFTGEHEFTIWVLSAYNGSFRESREEMVNIMEQLIGISRYYINDKVEYGVDVAAGTRVVLGKISGKVA
jgi:hypothetical protein